ncbi:T9SS type B sorting domain-containing protein [uncultured Flavobacterium sp.]|uniref:T9SS type B sorting domain-containing protein n=1 Tax=uncultured Flavobacterium sp. TaxID=165435 RepID=UPI003081784C
MQNLNPKNYNYFKLISFLLVFFITVQIRAQFPFSESFKNNTAPNILFGGSPTAFLTGGAGSKNGYNDLNGSGYLRLTNSSADQRGVVWSDLYAFPSAYGMTISFEYYSHSGSGADGIAFILFDATASPISVGSYGGSLGYAQNSSNNGFSKGYLGIGIDEYGSFGMSSDGKNGGAPFFRKQSAVTLRGAGNEQTGYPFLTTTTTTESPYLFNVSGNDRNATDQTKAGFRKIEIILKPRTPQDGFLIDVYITHGNTKTLVINNYLYTTPAPPNLKFAIASSTGGDNNFHEIRNLNLSVDLSTLRIPVAKPNLITGCSGSIITTSNDINENNDGTLNTLATINRSSIDLDLDIPGIQSSKTVAGKGTFTYDSITGKITFTPLNISVEGSAEINYTFNDTYGKTSNVSTITYNAIVNKPADIETTTTICAGETYVWAANGQSYTTPQTGLKVINNGCTANEILNLEVLPRPNIPTITTTTASCLAASTSKIDNYSPADNTYTFDPTGPEIDAQGFITNITPKIQYNVTSVSKTTNCSSLPTLLTKDAFDNSGCYPVLNTTVNSLTKSICNSPNETVSYEIKITNSGGQTAGAVKLDFIFPIGIIFDYASASYTNGSSGPTGSISFMNTASNPVIENFTIPSNGTVIILLKGKTTTAATTGTFSVNSEVTYLDPSRTISNPNRRITPYMNSYSATSSYESGGNVPGSNFDGSSTLEDDVVINPKPTTVTTKESICSGESFLWTVDGKTYSTSGTYTKTNSSCTANQILDLTVGAKPTTVTTKESICFGKSFLWAVDGKTYTTSGIYTKVNDGCTADQTLELTVNAKPITVTTKENICFGESFLWAVDGKTYTTSGIYTKVNDGCNADQTLELNIGTKPVTITTKENICFGETFLWTVNGKTYSTSGIYTKVNDGCTANQTLELNIGTKPATVITKESICSGESFLWAVDGKTYSVSGIYTQINDGCTADQTLELNIGTKPATVITKENICFGESFLWTVDGKNYSVSGIYTQTNDGCTADQTLELNIGAKPTTVTTKENICFGESFPWAVDGKTYSVSGIYTKANDGCTADQTLELNIGTKPATITTKESICSGESFLWTVDGKTYSTSGIYTKVNDGCTAEQVLELTVGAKPTTVSTKENICFGETFTWAVDGKTYSTSGIYTKTNNGCTADQVLELTVGAKPTTITTKENICFGETFTWSIDGKTYSTSGIYTKTNNGCNADQVLDLTVGTKPITVTTKQNICFGESFLWTVDGKTYTTSGIYTKTNNGCTADQVLDLNIGAKPTTVTTKESICFDESFLWTVDGKTYSTSGTYSKTNDGCTADQTLELNIGTKPATVITKKDICFGESFTWPIDGKTYSTSGTYTKTNDGCTPNQVLNLTVNPKTADIITNDVSICKGGTGSLTITTDSKPSLSFNGTWHPLTDPKTYMPTLKDDNNSICLFEDTALASYHTITFSVNVTGTYILKMTGLNPDYRAGYIYKGNYTLGTCPEDGTWITEGDDYGIISTKTPTLTAHLEVGTLYTLVSLVQSITSTQPLDYTWTLTPPDGGGFFLNPINSWYTAPTGGNPINWGTTFNPAGVSGSGLSNTNTAGKTTYYVGDITECKERVPVTFEIKEDAAVEVASSAPEVCINTVLPAITHLTSGITGINSSTNLPTGVSANFKNNTITITGTPTVSGIFNYNINLLNDNSHCGTNTATGTITVNALPVVPIVTTTNASCSTASISKIDNYVVGNSYIFDPTGPLVSSTGIITGMTTGSNYTVKSVNSACISASSPNFNFTEQLTSPTKPILSTIIQPNCDNATGSFTITNYDASYTYNVIPSTGVVQNGNTITVSKGEYQITAILGSCSSELSEKATVNEQPIKPSASISYPTFSYSTTEGTTLVKLIGMAGGKYTATPEGLTIDENSGAINPSVSSDGTYTILYSYTNGVCSNTTQTTVKIVSPKIASWLLVKDGNNNGTVEPGEILTFMLRLSNIDLDHLTLKNITGSIDLPDHTSLVNQGQSIYVTPQKLSFSYPNTDIPYLWDLSYLREPALMLTVKADCDLTGVNQIETKGRIYINGVEIQTSVPSIPVSQDGKWIITTGSNQYLTPPELVDCKNPGGCPTSLPVSTNKVVVLNIDTPEAVCFGTAVNLSSTVNTNSTPGILTYWTDTLATVSLTNPTAVVTSGTYYIKNTSAQGCEIIKPVIVTITPKPATVITKENICSGESFTWAVDGKTYSVSGIYTQINDGCTADQTLELNIGTKPNAVITKENICFGESFTWAVDEKTYSVSGIYTQINDGCTADQTLELNIGTKPNAVITKENICFGESFTWAVDGKTYSVSGIYTQSNDGCTADQTLELNIGTKPTSVINKESICSGESFTWAVDGKTYSVSGIYTQINDGCTADQTLELNIGTKPNAVITKENICFGESFTWAVDGKTYSVSGIYTQINDGCTADQTLELNIGTKPNAVITKENICFGESFTWAVDGKTYSVSGIYTQINDGCTADQTLELNIGTKPNAVITKENICFGESFTWAVDEKTYSVSGIYTQINDGCTADQTLELNIGTKPNAVITKENICFGESFTWAVDGKTYSASGIYTQSNDSCTADQTLDLNIGTKPNAVITKENICFGESFTWAVDGKTYSASGIYSQSNDGCTADQTLELNIGTKPATVITKENICSGESFTWAVDGKTYSVSGIYTQINDGCTADQTLELNIGTKPNAVITTKDICSGESFTWAVDGKTYSVSGIYSQSNDGCTADQTLELNIGTKPATVITKENICFGESFTWAVDGKTYSVSGIYSQSNDGCTADQTLELNIGTKPATVITKENICFGESFTWAVDGKTYSVSGIYSQSNDGCTADQTLELNIGTKPATVITKENICFGESFTWAVDGKTYSVSGIYSQSNDGCTADQTLELNIGTKPATVITKENICFGESFTWAVDGKTYSVSGIYSQSNDGCTADQTLELNIGTKPATVITKENICFGESFTWAVDGKTYSVSGIYSQSNDGCTADQTLELNIGTKPATVITKENICSGESFTWAVDGKTYSVSGIYTQINDGCTADQTLELNIGTKPNAVITTKDICSGESFTWAVDGKTYSVSGIYTQINDGCTADQTLDLNIGTKPATVITKENICFGESFPWAVDGKTYSVSGIYTQSNDGCTADQTLELNIGTKPNAVITKENICFGESFTWAVDGKTYSVSGIYTQSNDGCTADQTLELNIGTKPNVVITKENICFGESFTWAVDGKTYSASGIYTQSNDGCTADQTLELNIGTKPATVITKENICSGESFTWAVDGKTYSASGIYSQINDGCTADQTLELNIGTKPATVITKENICSGESFTWTVDGKTYSASGIYSQINDGCTADQTLELNVGDKPVTITTKISICFGESLLWNADRKTYTTSGIYTQINDGCTADQVLELTVGAKPNAVTTKEDICFGQSYTWSVNGETYNTSGTYTVKNNGCTADQVLDLNINQALNAFLVSNSTIPESCPGENNASFDIEITGGIMPYSINLDNKITPFTPVTNSEYTFMNLVGGSHTVYIKDALNCISELDVFIPKGITINPVANITYSCLNDLPSNSVTIMVDPSITDLDDLDYSLDGINYQADKTFVNVAAGTHTIKARHTNGCIQLTREFVVDYIQPLTLTLADGELNEIVATTTGGDGQYRYSFNNESFSTTNKFIIYKSGMYTVTVTDQNGCSATSSRYFEYVDVCISNYFTPNGDGVNDEWGPDCTVNYKNLTYTIFDRYGRTIATYKLGQKWDGKYNGAELTSGDYWYVLKLNDPKDNREFVGHFTLYR